MGYSFIIPVFNCRDTLADCVNSIRAAALSDYEIVLVDDGSTDGSGIICDNLAAEYPEIRAVHQSNAGVSAARNRGLEEAKKDYVLFTDGDDTLDSPVLREVGRYAGDLLIFGMTVAYHHRGVCYRRDTLGYPTAGPLNWQQEFAGLFGANALSPVWNKVFRRGILETHRIRFREGLSMYEDLEFVLRYLRYCESVLNIPKPVCHYRQSAKAAERIRRMGDISAFLRPIELALGELPLSQRTVDAVRLALYELLAREKCGAGKLRELSRDFQVWYEALEQKPERLSPFLRRLAGSRLIELWLFQKIGVLRHRAGVEVKTWISTL